MQHANGFVVGFAVNFDHFAFARLIVVILIRAANAGFNNAQGTFKLVVDLVKVGLCTVDANNGCRIKEPAVAEHAIVCPVGCYAANGGNGQVVHQEHDHGENGQRQNAVRDHAVNLV